MITVVGSFNMDLVIEVPRFPAPGEAILGRDFRRACGGKGANQALAIARMGHAVGIIGAVGQDAFGEEMVANLAAAGVDTRAVIRRLEVASGTAMIVLDATGQNQIVVANGANDTLSAADIESQADLIRRSRVLVIQLETPLDGVELACEIAHTAGVPVVLNPAPYAQVSETLLRRCRWIIPNEGEAALLSGHPVRNAAEAAVAARRIREAAPASEVLVTLGPKGVWLDTQDFTGQIPGVPVKAVDTVGAGDTFIGAFVARWIEGAGVVVAAGFGCAAAAIAVTRRGAQSSLPLRAEVDAAIAGRLGG